MWDAAVAEAFLPTQPQASVLLTSRTHDALHDLDNANQIPLQGLTNEQAVALLQHKIGLSPDAFVNELKEVVALTGNLPLPLTRSVHSWLASFRASRMSGVRPYAISANDSIIWAGWKRTLSALRLLLASPM